MTSILSRCAGILGRVAVIALPLAISAVAGPLDFNSITPGATPGACNANSLVSCLDISSVTLTGDTIDIQVDYALIKGADLSASSTFTLGTSLLGNTLFGCNYIVSVGCGTNFFDGSAWGGTPGTGTVEVVGGQTPTFHHGGPLFLDANFTDTSVTISYNYDPAVFGPKTGDYGYGLPFGFTFTNQASSAAPEPGTVGLMASALAGLALLARRRRA